MKVVILAGGFGTRMGELTKDIPKPMIPINHKPIIHHLMDYYHSFGFSDFIILTGYKGFKIREYFDSFSIQAWNILTIFLVVQNLFYLLLEINIPFLFLILVKCYDCWTSTQLSAFAI